MTSTLPILSTTGNGSGGIPLAGGGGTPQEIELREAKRFLQSALDALSAHIAILDENGAIMEVNAAWKNFGHKNSLKRNPPGAGLNYLKVCDSVSGSSSHGAAAVADGIRAVIAGQQEEFHLEYPCHSPREKRWFVVRITRFAGDGPVRVVVAHENITLRKQAEDTLRWKTGLFEAHLNTSIDGILVTDPQGQKIFQNQQTSNLFHIPTPFADDKDDTKQLEWVANSVANREQFLAKVVHLFAHPDEISRDEIVLKDGSVLDRYTSPLSGPEGACYGRLWTFRDITERKRMEELLRRSEEKFRGLVENLHDAVMTFDPSTHKFTSANPAGIAMFGAKNEEELISFGPGSLSPERQLDGSLSVEKVWKWMEAVDKGPQRFEWIHGRISGGTFFSEVMLTQMEHRGRRVFLSTIRDITERKRASDLLLDSQQRLQLATESAHIGIWDWDVVQDRLVWDAKMYALYGIPERESGGTFEIWQQCLHPLDRKRAEAEIAAALGGIKDFNTEFRVLWPTGEVRYIEAHGIVKRAADGSATRMIGVNRDITERKHAEEALHESEARFAGAFQCAPIGVGLVSLVGRFIKVNRALCDVFGYSEAELLNRNFQKITHPADLAADLENVRRLVAGETPSYQMEKRYIHAKGHFVTALLSVSLVRDGHGQPLHFISQIQDITERKLAVQQLTELKLNEERSRLALEQEKKSSQIKSRFVSLVSHEFRTPLSVINMATELLDGYFDKLTEAERSEHLDEIRSSVERMTQMMNDFLIHGNCASGKMECKPAWVEVKALCSRLISEVPHYAGSSSPIECFVDPALGKSWLDEKILAHILGNLLSNAVKYSLAGQPVKLEARRIADSPPPNGGTDTFSEPHVEFKVSDSGIGIPAADFAKLYQTFHRAGNVGNRPGAGMGLAIVKQFVDLLGGKIRFESNEGKGTTVWVQLPIALPKSQPER